MGIEKARNASVATRLTALVVLAALGVFAVGVLGTLSLHNRTMEERRTKTRAVVEAAVGLVYEYVDRERAGQLPRAPAQHAAAEALRKPRYDGEEYFWVNDTRAKMIMHPVKPELEGQDLGAMTDPDGKHLFREMVDVVERSGSGFVDYRWPKPGSEQPVPKVSFVKGVPEWGWVVGSGLYVDDVDRAFTGELRALGGRAVVVLAVLALSPDRTKRQPTAPRDLRRNRGARGRPT